MVSERDDLLQAIHTIEAQRHLLGQAAVEAATGPLLARLAALGDDGDTPEEAERKQITVVFADISGFTALSESADAEDIRDLINACFERVGAVAVRLGGYIDKYIGDELMVLFGAPHSMEDHAARALRAALEMREAMTAFNTEHAALSSRPLDLHFGINSGLVVAGSVGAQAQREYTVMGDTVNVAARLAGEAPGGAIFVGQDTCRLVGRGFMFSSHGAISLHGRSEPVQVFELMAVDESGPAAIRPDGAANASTVLFGRAEQLTAVQRLMEEVIAAHGTRSAAIVGAAGIGKSRLLQEIQEWAASRHPEAVTLTGAGLPHTTMQPYRLFIDLLGRSLEIRSTESPADVRARLQAWLERYGITAPEVLDGLAVMLGIDVGAGAASMAPRERRQQILTAIVALMRAVATVTPVLIAFEDLHWADQQSLELIRDLRAALDDVPVLLLLLSRPLTDTSVLVQDTAARLLSHADVVIDLGEFDEAMSADFVRALAPGIEAWPELVRTIASKSQGNPFFARSILGSLMDQGILSVGPDGTLRLRGAVGNVSVPDTVWSVLAERIDRLDPEHKRALQSASIVGPIFQQRLVGDLASAPQIASELEDLHTRDFVEPRGAAELAGDWEWAFRHALTQEVAYSGMLRSVRRAAHRRAATWLREHAGERRADLAALLAYHYERGEDWPSTAEFAEEAGDHASQIFANHEATAAYRQTLHALAQLDPGPEPQLRIVEVTLKLAGVSLESPSEEVLPLLEAAKDIAIQLDDGGLQLRVETATRLWLWTKYSRRGFR